MFINRFAKKKIKKITSVALIAGWLGLFGYSYSNYVPTYREVVPENVESTEETSDKETSKIAQLFANSKIRSLKDVYLMAKENIIQPIANKLGLDINSNTEYSEDINNQILNVLDAISIDNVKDGIQEFTSKNDVEGALNYAKENLSEKDYESLTKQFSSYIENNFNVEN